MDMTTRKDVLNWRKLLLMGVLAGVLSMPAGTAGSLLGLNASVDGEELILAPDTGASGACAATDPIPPLLVQVGLSDFSVEPNGGSWQKWTAGVDAVGGVPPPPDTASVQTVQELAEVQMAQLTRTGDDATYATSVHTGPAHQFWLDYYMQHIVKHASKTGKRNPPKLSREMAIVGTAMEDALILAWEAKYCFNRPAPSVLLPTIQPLVSVPALPSYPSEHAVVAGVMSALLPKLFSWIDDATCAPVVHPADCEEDPDGLEADALHAAYSGITAGTNYRSDIDAGLTLGRAVGNAVWNSRLDDGWNATSTRVRITGTCNWVPTPPAFRQTPLEPQWGDVRPWIMTSSSQFRQPPPPACDSQEYISQYVQQYYLTGTNGSNLNQRQKDIAKYWEGGQGTVTPPGITTWEASNVTAAEGLNSLRAARVVAYIGVGVADAGIGVWDTKFTFWWDRPVTAIPRLAAAGVLPPEAANWLPYLNTPPFPGYISGHSGFSAAAYFTLAHFFPEKAAEFRAKSTEAAISRYYGGIHDEPDNERGIALGMGISDLLVNRAMTDGAE